MENYYALLGVSINSSPEEIKRKFRQIQLEMHSNNDNMRIKDNYENICTAYKILSNINLKEQYDKTMNREIVIKDDPVIESSNTKAVDMFSVIGEHLLNNVMKNITSVDTHILPPVNTSPINNIPSNTNCSLNTNPQHVTEPQTIPPIVQVFPVTFLQAYKGCVLPIEIERKVYSNDANTSFVTENENISIDEKYIDLIVDSANSSYKILLNTLLKIKIYDNKIDDFSISELITSINYNEFNNYITEIKKGNINEALKIIFQLANSGISVIDILYEFTLYIKGTNASLSDTDKYEIITLVSKYITIFHDLHEDILELAFLTNDLISKLSNI